MPPDILLLILDTARADAFRPWGGPHPSPSLERLCQAGTWFTQAIAPAPWTLPSSASILTGLAPSEHGIDARAYVLRQGRPTSPAAAVRAFEGTWVPQALRERGYGTVAVSCNPWLSTWGGFDRGFDRFVDIRPWPPLAGGRLGRATRRFLQVSGRRGHGGREALAAFRRELGGAGPRFALVNLMETHAPYDPPLGLHPLRPGNRAAAPRATTFLHRQFRQANLRQRPDAAYVAALRALYLASARFADALAGAFVDAFLASSSGPAVVVVMSDHGENLGDHGLFAHHSSLHETLLHVPLVVSGRGLDLAAGRVTGERSLLGLAPWLLATADGEHAPPVLDGPVQSEYESTLRHIGMNRELRAWAADGGQRSLPGLVQTAGVAIRRGKWKYVALEDGREELYNLEADPSEEHELLAATPALAAPFRPARDAWLQRLSGWSGDEPGGAVADDEIADHLRSLGYIE